MERHKAIEVVVEVVSLRLLNVELVSLVSLLVGRFKLTI